MDEEEKPFLNAGSSGSQRKNSKNGRGILKYLLPAGLLLHLILFVGNIFVFVSREIQSRNETCYSHFPNRLKGTVARYESAPQLFTKFQDSPFTERPGPKTDKAWHHLMENMVIRVSGEELEYGNQTSIALPKGGHMAWLGAYHELHCIKMLHQFKYKDYYHPNISEQEELHLDIHADHCLEMLRASAMCHGDGSLTTFQWSPNSPKPMLDLNRPSHSCVDWSALMRSVGDRVVSDEELMELVNPIWKNDG